MWHCVYHPTEEMRVVNNDEEKDRLISTGYWFDHPTKAIEMRKKYEKRILDEKQSRGRKASKQNENDGI